MVKLIILGLIAGMFFSSTYILNEQMSHNGGHWFWSASLRYGFMLLLLSAWIAFRQGLGQLKQLAKIFAQYWRFWCVTGGIGFGVFYWGVCFAGDHASGWVVASTFMFTVVASLFVLSAFGQGFNKSAFGYALIIFVGVVMVNASEASSAHNQTTENIQHWSHILLYGALPAFIAAFCYPFGNQLVWQANENSKNRHKNTKEISKTKQANFIQSNIPSIETDLLDNTFNKIWLMSLGTVPFWLVLGVLIQPSAPNESQFLNTFLVALLSGVIATSIFLYARQLANTSQEVAGVDATQASEVIFSLIGGMLLLHTPLPSPLGLLGIVLIVLGLILFSKNA